jgi:hypothetical protein
MNHAICVPLHKAGAVKWKFSKFRSEKSTFELSQRFILNSILKIKEFNMTKQIIGFIQNFSVILLFQINVARTLKY